MVLRCSPLAYLQENGIANKLALTKAEENCLILCAGQGAYEGDALDDTQALADLLKDQGMPAPVSYTHLQSPAQGRKIALPLPRA